MEYFANSSSKITGYIRLCKSFSTSFVYVDYSRAFDTIEHNIILCKILKCYGLDINSLCWCQKYLSNRKQRVKLDNVISNYVPVEMRVPQGSIIGPFMFMVYINDLLREFEETHGLVTLYADYTILYVSDTNLYRACAMNAKVLINLTNGATLIV